jgi:hypothetical protein
MPAAEDPIAEQCCLANAIEYAALSGKRYSDESVHKHTRDLGNSRRKVVLTDTAAR